MIKQVILTVIIILAAIAYVRHEAYNQGAKPGVASASCRQMASEIAEAAQLNFVACASTCLRVALSHWAGAQARDIEKTKNQCTEGCRQPLHSERITVVGAHMMQSLNCQPSLDDRPRGTADGR
jgi:hypothetical protein